MHRTRTGPLECGWKHGGRCLFFAVSDDGLLLAIAPAMRCRGHWVPASSAASHRSRSRGNPTFGFPLPLGHPLPLPFSRRDPQLHTELLLDVQGLLMEGNSSCGPGPPGTHPRHPPARARPRPGGRSRPLRARSRQLRALRTHRPPATTRPRSRHRSTATPTMPTTLPSTNARRQPHEAIACSPSANVSAAATD